MKVKMLTCMGGQNRTLIPGQIVEVSPETGAAWIKARFAVAVEEKPNPPANPKPIQPGKPKGKGKQK